MMLYWFISGYGFKVDIQLLRFPFSLFLMPVYFFALSQVPSIDPFDSLLVFIILHLFVYPASNGFNSYMDRDTGPIGGIENPLPATKQLLMIATIMDLLAIIFSMFISWFFTGACNIYSCIKGI